MTNQPTLSFAEYVSKALNTKSPGFMRPMLVDGVPVRNQTDGKPTMECYVKGPATDFLHGSTGGLTEIGEFADALKAHIFYGKPLDYVNLAEEVGDQSWYLAIMANAADCDLSLMGSLAGKGAHHANDTFSADGSGPVTPIMLLSQANKLAQYWVHLNDAGLFYFKTDPTYKINLNATPDLQTVFYKTIESTAYLGAMLGYNPSAIWASNIAKLAKRYPNKFTTDDALFRTLNEERAILEAHHGENENA